MIETNQHLVCEATTNGRAQVGDAILAVGLLQCTLNHFVLQQLLKRGAKQNGKDGPYNSLTFSKNRMVH